MRRTADGPRWSPCNGLAIPIAAAIFSDDRVRRLVQSLDSLSRLTAPWMANTVAAYEVGVKGRLLALYVIEESQCMNLTNLSSLICISALMLACSLCEAAQKDVARSARPKAGRSGHSHVARPYGADLSEAESLRALEAEVLRKLGSKVRESDYPEEARRRGWSGTSLVAVSVGSNGKIKEVSIHRTSGFSILDEQALRMLQRVTIWWIPQRLRNREVKVIVPVGFYIRNN